MKRQSSPPTFADERSTQYSNPSGVTTFSSFDVNFSLHAFCSLLCYLLSKSTSVDVSRHCHSSSSFSIRDCNAPSPNSFTSSKHSNDSFSNSVDAIFVSSHPLGITIISCPVLWSYRYLIPTCSSLFISHNILRLFVLLFPQFPPSVHSNFFPYFKYCACDRSFFPHLKIDSSLIMSKFCPNNIIISPVSDNQNLKGKSETACNARPFYRQSIDDISWSSLICNTFTTSRYCILQSFQFRKLFDGKYSTNGNTLQSPFTKEFWISFLLLLFLVFLHFNCFLSV